MGGMEAKEGERLSLDPVEGNLKGYHRIPFRVPAMGASSQYTRANPCAWARRAGLWNGPNGPTMRLGPRPGCQAQVGLSGRVAPHAGAGGGAGLGGGWLAGWLAGWLWVGGCGAWEGRTQQHSAS